jgi:hypothetical protein
MKTAQKAVLWIGVVAAILLFLLLIWPTLYSYDRMTVAGTVFPVRTDRLTGKAEFLTSSGWRNDLYRYDHLTMNSGGTVLPVRIYLPTDKTEFLIPSGWTNDVDNRAGEQLPAQELAKITGTGQIESIGEDRWIKLSAYNGTQWTVKKLRIELTVTTTPGYTPAGLPPGYVLDGLKRLYDLSPEHPYTQLSACASGELQAALGFQLKQGQTWSFRIVGAWGTQ